MNKAMLSAYREQWKNVAQVDVEIQRKTTISQRWQKLNSLIRLAAGLNLLQKKDDSQIKTVRQRWNRLKNLYLMDTK